MITRVIGIWKVIIKFMIGLWKKVYVIIDMI